jgi:deoxyribonuclease-4
VSVAGGLHRAFERAAELGCEAIQIFVKNANRWQQRPLRADEIDAFRQARAQSAVGPVLAHASYLINVASPDAALRRRSASALGDELDRCALLGVDGLVLHPGAHMGDGPERAIRRAGDTLARVLERHGDGVELLIENTAGQGTLLGASPDELEGLLAAVDGGERVGLCLDSCHAFAAGWPIHRQRGWRSLRRRLGSGPLRAALRALHLNDSKTPFDSRRDRHANIGQGEIGSRGFGRIVRDPCLADLPMVVETPIGEAMAGYRRDLKILRRARDRSDVKAR